MRDFFHVKTVEEARETLLGAWCLTMESLQVERVDLLLALGRVLGTDVVSTCDVPPYLRSTVDGYAVAAKDTFGASPPLPAMVEIVEDIPMGSMPRRPLQPGHASLISTGGALPQGADACVMVEHTELLDERTVLIHRPVSPGENVVQPGEDVRTGDTLLTAGRVLTPYDVGGLAALGVTTIPVLSRPRIAIISTGDEVIPPTETPSPGEMRDVNTYSLSLAVSSWGCEPLPLGIAPDTFSAQSSLVEKGLETADMVVVSGGSSVGVRDVVVDVFSHLGPPGVLVHGVAVKPGKPVILGICRKKPVFGLPGHPVSALVALDLFVRYAVGAMLARSSRPLARDVDRGVLAEFLARGETFVTARLSRNIASSPGREDHVRVRLVEAGGELLAEPVFGKSGLISTMVRSGGEVVVPYENEGILAGTLVRVRVT